MAPKSRRKKKYAGQRSPQVVPASTAGAAKATRIMPASPRVHTQMAPSPSGANVGRELRTIVVLAGALLIALIVLSMVLT